MPSRTIHTGLTQCWRSSLPRDSSERRRVKGYTTGLTEKGRKGERGKESFLLTNFLRSSTLQNKCPRWFLREGSHSPYLLLVRIQGPGCVPMSGIPSDLGYSQMVLQEIGHRSTPHPNQWMVLKRPPIHGDDMLSLK